MRKEADKRSLKVVEAIQYSVVGIEGRESPQES